MMAELIQQDKNDIGDEPSTVVLERLLKSVLNYIVDDSDWKLRVWLKKYLSACKLYK